MRTLRLSTIAAVCALGTVICFVLGAVAMGFSGVGVLIPDRTAGTGLDRGRGWGRRVVLYWAWLVILMGFLGIVALVGFYDTLRLAGPAMILAPVLGAVGLTLVTVRVRPHMSFTVRPDV
jgi:cytochrome bd-type quinol oxidase subunit 2